METQRVEVKGRKKQLREKPDRRCSLWFCHFYFLQTPNGPNGISSIAQDRVAATVSVRQWGEKNKNSEKKKTQLEIW